MPRCLTLCDLIILSHIDSIFMLQASRGSLAKVMLHMTVEIGDGRSDTIDVRDGDDPRALADAFCRMHDLSVNVVEPLSDHIKVLPGYNRVVQEVGLGMPGSAG